MAKRGRPSSYTPEIAAEICALVAEGQSIRQICQAEGMPGRRTILEWLERDEEFRAKCARAWDMQADALADQQLEVAAGVLAGSIDPQAGKVAISTYQWLGSKRAPKRYGDRLELAGDKDNPIATSLTVEFVKAPEGK